MERDDSAAAAAILAAYDRERREVDVPGFRREQSGSAVLHFPLSGSEGLVSYSHHGDDEIEGAIRRVIGEFERVRCAFEWKVHDHDSPPDLRGRLEAAGFRIEEAEALMILPVAEAGALCEDWRHVRVDRVRDEAGIADFVAVALEVWPKRSWLDWIERELRDHHEGLTAYVAYEGALPVACARATFPAGGRFVGLWGGATRRAHRGRGFYRALVAARARDAAERGFDHLCVDALPTSRPILERAGFRRFSTTYPCRWTRQGT